MSLSFYYSHTKWFLKKIVQIKTYIFSKMKNITVIVLFTHKVIFKKNFSNQNNFFSKMKNITVIVLFTQNNF